MIRIQHFKTTVALAALFAAAGSFAAPMSKAETTAAKDAITATYKADKAACATSTGNARDVCEAQAKAVETKAMADLTLNEKVGDAKKEASDEKMNADYKVAAEKCDSLAGDAKSSCMTTAKTRFHKN